MNRDKKSDRGLAASILGAGLLVFLMAAGCDPGDLKPAAVAAHSASAPAVPALPLPVKLDLVADLPEAWVGYGNADHILDRRFRDQFTQGWYPVQNPSKDKKSVWSRGERSVIEITVLDPKERLLEIDIEPAPGEEKLPHQSIRLFWNNHDLGRFQLDWARQTLRIKLPAAMQQFGLNRLTFSPLYWISPLTSRISLDSRPVAFLLHGVRFAGPEKDEAESRLSSELMAEGERIEQPVNSMIAWHYLLPSDPKLLVKISWDLPPEEKGLVWRCVIKNSKGEERVLAERSPSGGGEESLNLDLSPYAGEMVGLEFLLSSTSPGDPSASITLDYPVIEGTQASPASASVSRQPYNVLVVLFDTLRADHLEPYGSASVRTPELKRFASTGFTFEQAHSNASWTRPAIASLWTGLHPSGHQLAGKREVLPESIPYLPEILSDDGYLTISVSNNAYFSSDFGFDRGYSKLLPYFNARRKVLQMFPSPEEQAERVWEQFLAPFFDNPEGQPVFALLHEIDPHSPYEAPDRFSAPYLPDYSGNIDGWKHNIHEHLLVIKAINSYGDWLSTEDKKQMQALYKGEVSFVDAYFGALLGHLERAGLRENTLVVFLSDHGEQLFDHGGWGHGNSVYQEELRIPLIFSLPGVIPESKSSNALVQGVDVLPTLLDLLGVPAPEGGAGRSLLPIIFGTQPPSLGQAPIYAWSNIRVHGDDALDLASENLTSVRQGRWKLVRTTHKRKSIYNTYQLYRTYQLFDLDSDPGEEVDLWFRQPVVGHTLRQSLETKIRRDSSLVAPAGEAKPLGAEVEENLRALGYVE
ncbi:MAG: sulfatase [Myxococcota bacterium]|jgi:arylsulfatase A-like enzyme|nr:sulfatase [Myxococcota bacterium]